MPADTVRGTYVPARHAPRPAAPRHARRPGLRRDLERVLSLPSTTLAWSANTFNSSSERQLVSLTNQARASAGLKALRVDSALTAIARGRSKDMIVRNYFSHNIPPSGYLVFHILDTKGYCYKIAGENIGWNNYPDDVATAEIQGAFMDSSRPPGEHPRQGLGRHRDRRLQGPGRQEDVDGPVRRQVRLDVDRAQADAEADAQADRATPKPTPPSRPRSRSPPRSRRRSRGRRGQPVARRRA